MAIEKDELIAKIKEVLKPELTQISYETWILPLGIRSIDGNHIIFTTPLNINRILLKINIEVLFSIL